MVFRRLRGKLNRQYRMVKHRPVGVSRTHMMWITVEWKLARVHRRVWPTFGLVKCVGVDLLDEVRGSGRGVIFVSFHSVYEHVGLTWFQHLNRGVDWTIHAIVGRAKMERESVFEKQFVSRAYPRDLVRRLKCGEGVVILQDMVSDDGTPVSLYNFSANFQLGSCRLAAITDFTMHSAGPQGLVRLWPVIDHRECDAEVSLGNTMRRMIMSYPETWPSLRKLIDEKSAKA